MDNPAFVSLIAAEPDNTEAKLIYADWLEERGECKRGEILRLEVALAAHGPEPRTISGCYYLFNFRHGEFEITMPGTNPPVEGERVDIVMAKDARRRYTCRPRYDRVLVLESAMRQGYWRIRVQMDAESTPWGGVELKRRLEELRK